MEYLTRPDFHQVLRNEILWGLIPKTLVAGLNAEYQHHNMDMAMKTLECEGFLRGIGMLQLETIQKFFEIIKEKPVDEEFDLTVTTTSKVWRGILTSDKSAITANVTGGLKCTPSILRLRIFMEYFDTPK